MALGLSFRAKARVSGFGVQGLGLRFWVYGFRVHVSGIWF